MGLTFFSNAFRLGPTASHSWCTLKIPSLDFSCALMANLSLVSARLSSVLPKYIQHLVRVAVRVQTPRCAFRRDYMGSNGQLVFPIQSKRSRAMTPRAPILLCA